METETANSAQILWDYLKLDQKSKKSDLIFVLCSIDIRVAKYAANLFLQGYGNHIVFSGGTTKNFDTKFGKSEAKVFAEIAINMGIPVNRIIIEEEASNTGANIQFTYSLLKAMNLIPSSMILVHKPYMERRTLATFLKQWPDPNIAITVTSPPIAFNDYFDDDNYQGIVLNTMVGDFQRIMEYPKLGYQTEQLIPPSVRKAYEVLIAKGYTKRLISV